eukprot:9099767-Pyramimonas_sp.AAC.1
MLYFAARYAGIRYYGCGKAQRSGLVCADYADRLTAACADCADPPKRPEHHSAGHLAVLTLHTTS